MDIHTATEVAYKNGYADGKREAAREIFEELTRTVMHENWASNEYKKWYFVELKKKYMEGQK